MTRRPDQEVSDHAVLRELERVHGVDVEGVRKDIARKVRRGLDQGAVGVLVDGLRYILRQGVVVTVLRGPRSAAVEARKREGGDGGA